VEVEPVADKTKVQMAAAAAAAAHIVEQIT
jgi:hypothetical protein